MLPPRLEFGRTNLVVRGGPNWMAVVFFAALGALHLAIAIPVSDLQDLEASITLGLGAFFAVTACVSWLARREVALLMTQRVVCISFVLGRKWFSRRIGFQQVHAVKLMTRSPRSSRRPRIQICLAGEQVNCPLTAVPQQQALCMAMSMGVRLIKICVDTPLAGRNRITGLTYDALAGGDDPTH